MKERKSWGDFYAGAGGVDYFLDHLAIHKDFLKEILNRQPRRTLEAGCGSAIMSVFLSLVGVEAMACDRDEEVLKKAGEIASTWRASTSFSKQDILKTSFSRDAFDLVFSQGVLEHLSDGQIRSAASEALRIAGVFVFSVPGPFYKHQDFGDERLISERAWAGILSGIGRLEIKPYYRIRTKRNFLINRPLMLMGVLTR